MKTINKVLDQLDGLTPKALKIVSFALPIGLIFHSVKARTQELATMQIFLALVMLAFAYAMRNKLK